MIKGKALQLLTHGKASLISKTNTHTRSCDHL